MTTSKDNQSDEICPAQSLLKLLSGKWKLEVFRLAVDGPLRFSSLLRQIEGSNKQSLSVALKEMEEVNILERVVVQEKPLHVEYYLSDYGKSLIPILRQLEEF